MRERVSSIEFYIKHENIKPQGLLLIFEQKQSEMNAYKMLIMTPPAISNI